MLHIIHLLLTYELYVVDLAGIDITEAVDGLLFDREGDALQCLVPRVYAGCFHLNSDNNEIVKKISRT